MSGTDALLSLLQVRDAAYEHGQPWFEWVVIDAASNEIVGYFRDRAAAEAEMHRRVEAS